MNVVIEVRKEEERVILEDKTALNESVSSFLKDNITGFEGTVDEIFNIASSNKFSIVKNKIFSLNEKNKLLVHVVNLNGKGTIAIIRQFSSEGLFRDKSLAFTVQFSSDHILKDTLMLPAEFNSIYAALFGICRALDRTIFEDNESFVAFAQNSSNVYVDTKVIGLSTRFVMIERLSAAQLSSFLF